MILNIGCSGFTKFYGAEHETSLKFFCDGGDNKMSKIDYSLAVILSVTFVAILQMSVREAMPNDIVSPYLAAWFFDHHNFSDIYNFNPIHMFDGQVPPDWTRSSQIEGYHGKHLFPYMYPPIWAALIAPVTKTVTIPEFTRIAYYVNFVLICLSAILSWKIANRPMPLTVWLFVVYIYIIADMPGLAAIAQDQPHILVVFLMLLGLERLHAGFSLIAGGILAVAAAVKITPVLLILVFVMRKDWRGFWAMTVAGLCMLALSFAIAGPALHIAYLEQLNNTRKLVFVSVQNWSFSGSVYQLTAGVFGYPKGSVLQGYSVYIPRWISVCSSTLLGFGLVYWVGKLPGTKRLNSSILYTIIFAWIGFFGPMGWSYYYLPVLFLWPAVICVGPNIFWRLGAFAGFLLLFEVHLAHYFGEVDLTVNYGQYYGAIAVLLALGFLIVVERTAILRADPS